MVEHLTFNQVVEGSIPSMLTNLQKCSWLVVMLYVFMPSNLGKQVKISPSILSGDFANLQNEITLLDKTDADYIHLDIMDGSFVPNLTFGPPVVKSIKPFTQKPFDVHLMINNPQNMIDLFADAGADIITIHYEACIHHDRIINYIKSKGIKAGISLVPSTHQSCLDYIIEDLDLVLIMSVNPGFGGQKFLSSSLAKIEAVANQISQKNLQTEVSVDGGINEQTAKQVINAGASVLVAGNFIFNSDLGQKNHQTYQSQINKLRYCKISN